MSSKSKRLISVFIVTALMLSAVSLSFAAGAYTEGDYEYEIYYNEWAEIEKYNGNDTTVVIPEKINGLPVRCIGKYAFDGKDIVKVTMPSDLRCIYAGAFDNCAYLNTVELNEGLESIYSCFKSTAVKSIAIPSSVDYLSATAFSGCASLTEIVFEADYRCDVNIFDADKTENGFSENAVLKFNGIPSASMDITLRNMFYACKETQPYYIYELEDAAGHGSSLDEVLNFGGYSYIETDNGITIVKCEDYKSAQINIPSNILGQKVTAIGEFAFSPIIKIGDSKDDLILGDMQYSFTKIIVPDSVKKIDRYAFAQNSSLEEAVLPESLISLSYGAFYNCPNLSKANIPNGINVLEDNVFEKCSLDGVNVPENVSLICGSVFGISPDTDVSDIVIPDTVEYMGSGVFTDYSLKEFKLPQNLKVLEGTFENQAELGTVVFDEDIIKIGKNTFSQCDSLEEITMPQSVTELGSEAFYGCDKLNKVTVSPSVNVMSEAVFADCISLDRVIWRAENKKILKDAFKNCPLRSFDFSNSNGIGAGAFKESKIEKVKVGEGQENEESQTIGAMSFMSCDMLETVALGGNVSEIGSQAFADCENLETVIIADSVSKIAPDAFEDSDNVTIYCLEDSYAEGYARSQAIKVTTLIIDAIPNQTYTSKEIKPNLSVHFSSKTLTKGKDYTAEYFNNLNVGTASVYVSGLGDLSMLMSKADFAIIARSITDTQIKVTEKMTFNNEPCIPDVTVKYAGNTLKENVDYTLSFANNNSVGTGTVRIKGIGNFKGTAEYNFEIKEDEPGIAEKIIEIIVTLWRRFISWVKNVFN